jgi:hypothetical protein
MKFIGSPNEKIGKDWPPSDPSYYQSWRILSDFRIPLGFLRSSFITNRVLASSVSPPYYWTIRAVCFILADVPA